MKRTSLKICLFLLATFPCQAAVVIGAGHLDVHALVNSTGEWEVFMQQDGSDPSQPNRFDATTSSILHMPEGYELNRPAGAAWDFIGTAAGQPVWIFPESEAVDYVYPGFNTEGIEASTLGSWNPSHGLVGEGRWIEFRLLGFTYSGEGTNNHFSMWKFSGGPIEWMSTADGIAGDGSADSYFVPPGGHSHMSWGFTSEGIYDLTFEARTFLANGEESISDPFTLRFGINAIPEPSTTSAVLLLSALLLSRRKR